MLRGIDVLNGHRRSPASPWHWPTTARQAALLPGAAGSKANPVVCWQAATFVGVGVGMPHAPRYRRSLSGACAQVDLPLGVTVELSADQAPVGAFRDSGSNRKDPAELG